MGRNNRNHKHIPFNQKRIKAILRDNPSNKKPEPSVEAPKLILSREYDYDTLNPIDNLLEFLSFTNQVLARYDYLAVQQQKLDRATQDVLHFAELSDDMNTPNGYKVYRRMRDIRRERRVVKNEMELLRPLKEWLQANEETMKSLNAVQEKVTENKAIIDTKKWSPYNDIDM